MIKIAQIDGDGFVPFLARVYDKKKTGSRRKIVSRAMPYPDF
jgi:hypothetical protein